MRLTGQSQLAQHVRYSQFFFFFRFDFYCILIDTKDSIKNAETLPLMVGFECYALCQLALPFIYVSLYIFAAVTIVAIDANFISHPIIYYTATYDLW